MAQLRYLSPFAFLALLPLGGVLGGGWTFLAAVATPLCLAVLDGALGNQSSSAPRHAGSRWIAHCYVVLQLAGTAWAAVRATSPSTGLLELLGLTASAGVTTGVFGFVAAHELIHSRDRRDRALGLTFLATVFYMHFRIAHLYGHHRRAATFEDPASARLGEGLYAFLLRSIAGQFREAWRFEARRSRHPNRMVDLSRDRRHVSARSRAGRAGASCCSPSSVAMIAVTLLESFNYVAHYGLSRPAGERLAPHHSWNSERRMNNASLLNMGRHSDHHRRCRRSYAALETVVGLGNAAVRICGRAADRADSAAVAQDHGPARAGRDGARLGGHAVKVVLVGVLDPHRDDVAGLEPAGIAQVDFAVDLGRVGLRAAGRAAGFLVDGVDQDVDASSRPWPRASRPRCARTAP